MNTEQKSSVVLTDSSSGRVLPCEAVTLAMNHDVLPGTDVRLAALVCCGLACLAAGALSPRPEQGRALGGAMTWAVWAIGYLILKAAVGAQVFCAATAVTLLTALAAAIRFGLMLRICTSALILSYSLTVPC